MDSFTFQMKINKQRSWCFEIESLDSRLATCGTYVYRLATCGTYVFCGPVFLKEWLVDITQRWDLIGFDSKKNLFFHPQAKDRLRITHDFKTENGSLNQKVSECVCIVYYNAFYVRIEKIRKKKCDEFLHKILHVMWLSVDDVLC